MSGSVGHGRAQGKVILFGEHAVVYGAPAIAAGIPRGALATATPCEAPASLRLGGATTCADEQDSDLARAFAALLSVEPPLGAVAVDASSELLAGGGLGSSAALAVAIARAAEDAHGHAANDETVFRRAMAWEAVFHGNPSGIDATAALRGGCFRFERGQGATPLPLGADLWLCVGSTGVGAPTKQLVASVARQFERLPELRQRTLEAVGSLVGNATLALKHGDLTAVGKLMDLNQMILAGLLVSNEAIEQLCNLARTSGALGAKLTGAGGGGSVVALAASRRVGAEELTDDDAGASATQIVEAWKNAGFEGFIAPVRAQRPGDTPESH